MEAPRYRAQPLSRMDIRRFAKGCREKLGLANEVRIDILWLMENVFPVLFRKYNFRLEIVTAEELGGNHGLTNPETGRILIREDVYEGAYRGNGRDRLTMTHEFAHFMMHDGVTLGLARVGEYESIPTYCDPEWQANAFAAEFLMDADLIRDMTPAEIAKQCGVSLQAATYQKSKIK